MKRLLSVLFFLMAGCLATSAQNILIEAESFQQKGGWVVDQQSQATMGTSYLMAHGMGEPVEDASTEVYIPKRGSYAIYVRTYNWTSPWYEGEGPGRFGLSLNGVELHSNLGTTGKQWAWQKVGEVNLKKGLNQLSLHDYTGFNGRCDAIFLSRKSKVVPPEENLADFRRQMLPLKDKPTDAGHFDLVVVGGGIAGCTAAVSAARLGCKVALIQNRPLLGGNNSSEVRVGLSGLISQHPYPNLGNTVDELGGVGFWTLHEARKDKESLRSRQILKIIKENPEKRKHNAGPASNYADDKKLAFVQGEKNVSLFLNTHVFDVKKEGNRIVAVVGRDIMTGQETIFHGTFFADCTGDGDVGFLAGADYRVGRESKAQTGEKNAPEKADKLVMGTSVQWYANEEKENSTFPECPWAVQFNEKTALPILRGDWNWEAGLNNDQITEIEYIRDHALRAAFGNWSFLKNHSSKKEQFANKKLAWVAYIGGKRESRRLMGDVILCEQDIMSGRQFDDATFTTTWEIDLHYPKARQGVDDEPFLSYAIPIRIQPFAVPYRCLYSRNVENLFMAGRNISVTHIALGTVRVMRTGGMMGEVVGMATSLCKKHSTQPRAIYSHHLDELKALMKKGVGVLGFPESGLTK